MPMPTIIPSKPNLSWKLSLFQVCERFGALRDKRKHGIFKMSNFIRVHVSHSIYTMQNTILRQFFCFYATQYNGLWDLFS